jgi:hypothetical protein
LQGVADGGEIESEASMNATPRRFSVCESERDPHSAQPVEAVSFEAAAIAYAEDVHLGVAAEARLIVRDLETGAEQGFVVHLAVDRPVADPI